MNVIPDLLLQGTFSKDKHEILFSRFEINYNQLDARFRKGSVLVREEDQSTEQGQPNAQAGPAQVGEYLHPLYYCHLTLFQDSESPPTSTDIVGEHSTVDSDLKDKVERKKAKKDKKKAKAVTRIVLLHCDVIRDDFWDERPSLLAE